MYEGLCSGIVIFWRLSDGHLLSFSPFHDKEDNHKDVEEKETYHGYPDTEPQHVVSHKLVNCFSVVLKDIIIVRMFWVRNIQFTNSISWTQTSNLKLGKLLSYNNL